MVIVDEGMAHEGLVRQDFLRQENAGSPAHASKQSAPALIRMRRNFGHPRQISSVLQRGNVGLECKAIEARYV